MTVKTKIQMVIAPVIIIAPIMALVYTFENPSFVGYCFLIIIGSITLGSLVCEGVWSR